LRADVLEKARKLYKTLKLGKIRDCLIKVMNAYVITACAMGTHELTFEEVKAPGLEE